jgi:hypothetical protein
MGLSNETQTNNWRDYRDHVLGGGNYGCCWVALSGCGGVSCGFRSKTDASHRYSGTISANDLLRCSFCWMDFNCGILDVVLWNAFKLNSWRVKQRGVMPLLSFMPLSTSAQPALPE